MGIKPSCFHDPTNILLSGYFRIGKYILDEQSLKTIDHPRAAYITVRSYSDECEPHLRYAKSKEAMQSEPSDFIYIENIKNVEYDNEDSTIVSITWEKRMVTKVWLTNQTEAATWHDILTGLLKEQSENPIYCKTSDLTTENIPGKVYAVQVIETSASQACNLTVNTDYELIVGEEFIALKEPGKPVILWKWPIGGIRRYGRSDQSFTFEAGNRCLSPGVFTFETAIHCNLFDYVMDMSRRMKQRNERKNLKKAGKEPQLPSLQAVVQSPAETVYSEVHDHMVPFHKRWGLPSPYADTKIAEEYNNEHLFMSAEGITGNVAHGPTSGQLPQHMSDMTVSGSNVHQQM